MWKLISNERQKRSENLCILNWKITYFIYCPTTVFGQIFLKKVVKSLQIPSVQSERKFLTYLTFGYMHYISLAVYHFAGCKLYTSSSYETGGKEICKQEVSYKISELATKWLKNWQCKVQANWSHLQFISFIVKMR